MIQGRTAKQSVKMKRIALLIKSTFLSSLIFAISPPVLAETGDPLPDLSPIELSYFIEGKERFEEVEVAKNHHRHRHANDTTLGPRFNLDGCSGCHSQPNVGGTSPAVNPQVAVATKLGARNVVPSFIKLDGPIREARFKRTPSGDLDGGVHGLFVISGRSDAGSCNITQPDFEAELANNNLSFRIPTPVFGLGLLEMITDTAILNNKNANRDRKRDLGISGHENRNGNDGTITRFGWKAQNKSLMIFAGEAYNVEQGITNELFPNKRDETPECVSNGLPEDHTFLDEALPLAAMSDVVAFNHFMRFLAPPTPKPSTPASIRGGQLFNSIGCGMCHTPTLKTGTSSVAALSNKSVNLYSDLLVHHMGTTLQDDVVQGLAGRDEFRTAPLWGISDRLFFMHDGRTSSLMTAIQLHASRQSEANRVIDNFNRLSGTDKNNIIQFLQTL